MKIFRKTCKGVRECSFFSMGVRKQKTVGNHCPRLIDGKGNDRLSQSNCPTQSLVHSTPPFHYVDVDTAKNVAKLKLRNFVSDFTFWFVKYVFYFVGIFRQKSVHFTYSDISYEDYLFSRIFINEIRNLKCF
jgi:hypothetical protein